MVSFVGTSTSAFAIDYPFQRKTFYANNRFWVVYSTGLDLVYDSSADGFQWLGPTAITPGQPGYTIGIFFDGTRVHYARAIGAQVWYRRGVPGSDGVITWDAAEQLVQGGNNLYPQVTVDSNGFPLITYIGDIAGVRTPYLTKSSTNDGTWVTDAGFPMQLNVNHSLFWAAQPIRLTNLRIGIVYARDSDVVKGRLWDGALLGAEEDASINLFRRGGLSAVPFGDDMEVVFLFRHPTSLLRSLIYVRRDFVTGLWSAEEVLVSPTNTADVTLNLALTDENLLYLLYAVGGSTSINAMVRAAGAWTNFGEILSDSLGIQGLTLFDRQLDRYLGYAYVRGSAAPYDVMFESIGLLPTAVKSAKAL